MINKLCIPLIVVWVIFILVGCGNFEPDNSCDPRNPKYQKPSATIISGPKNGDTLSLSEVLFTWEGNDVNCPCSYSYKLAYASAFNYIPWSDWTSATSVIIDDLDEESYIFGVKAQYPTGDEQVIPVTRQFVVNAYRETSLLIKPALITVPLNQQFTIEITAEEVVNLMAAKINIDFSKDTLEIIPNGIQKGEFLKKNGGEGMLFDSVLNSEGKVEIDLGVTPGTSQGVSGSGTLAKITFKSKIKGVAYIRFESYDLRDINNQSIQVIETRNGKVIID